VLLEDGTSWLGISGQTLRLPGVQEVQHHLGEALRTGSEGGINGMAKPNFRSKDDILNAMAARETALLAMPRIVDALRPTRAGHPFALSG
jgi:hypothetical protein